MDRVAGAIPLLTGPAPVTTRGAASAGVPLCFPVSSLSMPCAQPWAPPSSPTTAPSSPSCGGRPGAGLRVWPALGTWSPACGNPKLEALWNHGPGRGLHGARGHIWQPRERLRPASTGTLLPPALAMWRFLPLLPSQLRLQGQVARTSLALPPAPHSRTPKPHSGAPRQTPTVEPQKFSQWSLQHPAAEPPRPPQSSPQAPTAALGDSREAPVPVCPRASKDPAVPGA